MQSRMIDRLMLEEIAQSCGVGARHIHEYNGPRGGYRKTCVAVSLPDIAGLVRLGAVLEDMGGSCNYIADLMIQDVEVDIENGRYIACWPRIVAGMDPDNPTDEDVFGDRI